LSHKSCGLVMMGHSRTVLSPPPEAHSLFRKH
jgi:hypothetical protein